MMPIHPSTWLSYAFAILAGFAFGFVLEGAGFGSAKKLTGQFYLRDMTVLKVMFTAIVTAMLGLTVLRAAGLVDFDQVFVNPTFLGPQVVGGLVFGAGFVIGGYCPGTAIVGAATGKVDALVFLAGIGGGVLAYGGTYPRIEAFAKSGSGDRAFVYDWLHLPYAVVAILVTLMALGMFAGAERIERYFAEKDKGAPKPSSKGAASHAG